jgi:predicted amidohydrolase YtcJ
LVWSPSGPLTAYPPACVAEVAAAPAPGAGAAAATCADAAVAFADPSAGVDAGVGATTALAAPLPDFTVTGVGPFGAGAFSHPDITANTTAATATTTNALPTTFAKVVTGILDPHPHDPLLQLCFMVYRIGAPLMPHASPTLPARVRLTGARFWTADPMNPWASSVDIADGRITAVDAPPRPDVPTITLPATAVVTPGLIDAHIHLSLGGQTLAQLDLSAVHSRAEFEVRITEAARTLPPERWLRAFGWNESHWGGERPTRAWLRGAGNTPCVAYRMDQHACVVNDAVLALIGNDPCPAGGEIVRDSTGNATGLLLEQAAWQLVNPRVPTPPVEDRRAALLAAFRHCNTFGITTVGSMEYESDLRETHEYLRTHARAACTVRVIATILDRTWPVDFAWGRAFAHDELLTIVGWKSFIDGTLGSRTARMLLPYSDDVHNRGMLVEFAAHHPDRLRAWARTVIAHGFSPSVHVIGDEALRIALDAIAPEDHARVARFEHCQTMDDAELARMHGRIASMQPLHKADDARGAPARLGDDRMHTFFRFRDLLTTGARLAFGSDWPIVSCDPRLGIRAAVTGLGLDGAPCRTDQNLTVEESLRAYTSGAADALRAPALGRIAPGCHADFCVFTDDPFACHWADTLPRIMATIAAGTPVYGSIAP